MDRDATWFRRLLRLFPAEFQADYAADMERTFRAQQEDANRSGARAVVRLWGETVLDLIRTAPREHVEQLAQDVRYGLRTMAHRPGFTAATSIVLAAGIAATTGIFGVVDAAVLRPLPYQHPERLLSIREQVPQEPTPWELSYPAYVEIRRESATLATVAGYMRNGIVIGGTPPSTRLAALVSYNLLEALGVRPIAGRAFTADEDAPGGPPAALIRDDLAQARFGSPEDAIGRTLSIDDRAVTIVGVLPTDMRFPDGEIDVWLPIGTLAAEPWIQNRAVHVVNVLARLREGVPVRAARAELEGLRARMQGREPAADPDHGITVRPLAEDVSAGAMPAMKALVGAVLLLLVVTCSSVGVLLLTRATGRGGEMAIRQSLGASRGRLARQLITEVLCLSAAGCVLGVAVASPLIGFLHRGLEGSLPPFVQPHVNGAALATAILTALATAIVSGVVPAARVLNGLRSRGVTPRPRSTLLVGHVAVSCVLVVLAALLGRSLDRLLRVDIGFRPERLLVMRVNRPPAASQAGGMTAFYETAANRIRRLPGVAAVAVVSTPPLQPGARGDLTVAGQPRRVAPVVSFRRALPGYFAALGIPIVEGRDFTERDDGTNPVVIVSAAMARRFWPAGQAIGQRIKVGPPDQESWKRVVGVVGDVRNVRLDEAVDLATYEPHAQRPWNGMFVMVRTIGEPAVLADTVERALREDEPQVIVSAVSTMDQRIAASVAPRRFHTVVVGAFAAATLLLVAVALYATLAYSVSSRAREFGIRSALGASTSALRRHVLMEGLRPTTTGLVLGLGAGGFAASAAQTLLFEVTPGDATTYVGTIALVLAVAAAACWGPARRSTKVDPTIALRAE